MHLDQPSFILNLERKALKITLKSEGVRVPLSKENPEEREETDEDRDG